MEKSYKRLYQIKEVLPNIHVISSSTVMMFLVVGTKRALLIDTGYGFSDPHEIIRSITKLPFDVVNSHGHIDHAAGNFYFKEEDVFIHRADLEVFRRHTCPRSRRLTLESLDKVKKLLSLIGMFPKNMDEQRYISETFDENRFNFVQEGFTFHLGDLDATVIELPGHTPGSIGFQVSQRNLIITADAANPNEWLFMPEAEPLSVYRKTLKKLQGLNMDYILTGHMMRLFRQKDLENWISVANNPDFENGKPMKNGKAIDSIGLAPGVQSRNCTEKNNPRNKAKLRLSADKLD